MNKIFKVINVFSVIFLVLLLSCGKSDDNVIRIAVIGPSKISAGKAIKKAVELARQEIMKKGGIIIQKGGEKVKHSIEFVFIDDKISNISHARSELRKAIDDKNCKFIIGGFSSKVVVPLMDIMADKKVIWFGTGGASPKVIANVKNNYEKYKYYFRVGTIDATLQGKAIAEFAKNVLMPRGLKKVAVLGVNQAFSKYVLKDAIKHMKVDGFEIVVEEYVNSKNANFEEILKKSSKADFIVCALLTDETHAFIKKVHEMGLNKKMPIIGSLSKIIRDQYEQGNDKVTYYTAFQPQGGPVDMTSEGGAIRFTVNYAKKYQESPFWVAYIAYDTLYIYKDVVEKANSIKAQDIIKVMENPDYEYIGNIRYKWHKNNHDLIVGYHQGKNYAEFVWFQFFPDGKRYCVYPGNFRQKKFYVPNK